MAPPRRNASEGLRHHAAVRAHWSVRDAVEGDVERIAEIKVRNWGDTYGPLVPPEVLEPFLDRGAAAAQLRGHLASAGILILVGEQASGPLQGYALTHLAQPPEPWLESLHVVAEERGHGLGRILLGETARRVIDAGYRSLSLGVILGNDAAGRLYQRLGAVVERVEPVTWARGVSHTVWRWPDEASLRALAG